MSVIAPTTELEAINIMLTAIGESPVDTTDALDFADASVAKQILGNVNREVQSRGWAWNLEKSYTVLPNAQNKFQLPLNALRVDETENRSDVDMVHRGIYLYDRKNNTYTPDIPSIDVDLVLALPFEELPEPNRRYIILRATRIFQERVLGSSTLSEFQRNDEKQAWAECINYDVDVEDANILTGSTPASILNRRGFYSGGY